MAIATTAAILLATSAAASAGSSIYAAKKQSSAAKRAGEQASQANREALEFEREQDRLDREEALRVEALNRDAFEEAQREDTRRFDLGVGIDERRYGASEARAGRLDALDRDRFNFEQTQYGNRQTQMAPYRARGVEALNRLSQVANIQIRPTTPPAPSMADLGRG